MEINQIGKAVCIRCKHHAYSWIEAPIMHCRITCLFGQESSFDFINGVEVKSDRNRSCYLFNHDGNCSDFVEEK